VWSAIWKGERLIGYISYDNLIKRQPIRETDGELLAIYASTLGHLLSRKRIERTLREREQRHRQVAESRRRLLIEVNHRVRNNLAQLLWLIKMSSRAKTVRQFTTELEHRIRAMCQIHNVLASCGWQDIELDTLIRALLASMARTSPQATPIQLHEPAVLLDPQQAISLAMTIQELFTNSAKYGANSSPSGQVRLGWTLDGDNGCSSVHLRWTEFGGPAITVQPTPAAGTALMEDFIKYDLGGRCQWRYPPTGADHLIQFPLTPPEHLRQRDSDSTLVSSESNLKTTKIHTPDLQLNTPNSPRSAAWVRQPSSNRQTSKRSFGE